MPSPVYLDQAIATNANVKRSSRTEFSNDINLFDTWMCGFSEDHVCGSQLGILFSEKVRSELTGIRDSERFFFQRRGYFSDEQIQLILTIRRLVGLTP